MIFLCLLSSFFASSAAQGFVKLSQDADSTWWFLHGGEQFLSFVANHVNNGGEFDGVGGRESAVCQAATNNSLCGDSLNFAGSLNYAPYYNVSLDKYGPGDSGTSAWANASISRLFGWGFNGISGWSHPVAEAVCRVTAGCYYFHLLDLGTTWPHSGAGLDFDVWSTNFSAQVTSIVTSQVTPLVNDERLIAWQTDNELQFGVTSFPQYLTKYASGPGGGIALSWLQSHYASIAALNAAWLINCTSWSDVGAQVSHAHGPAFDSDCASFSAVVADRYFNVTVGAIRAVDTNHLISGVRFAPDYDQAWFYPVIDAWAKYAPLAGGLTDVHDYGNVPDIASLQRVSTAMGGGPIVLGEYSFTAMDSNMPNTHGARAGVACTTQTQRTAMYTNYARALINAKFAVGYGWWNWADEPSTGRWPDGENSNYGLLTLADDPYLLLTAAMTQFHASAVQLHVDGSLPPPPPPGPAACVV